MDKLDKTYEAVSMLESLGLPVSNEQLILIAQMEKDYLRDVIIPLLKQELEPMVEKMRNQFNMAVSYNRGGGLDIQLLESAKQSMNLVSGSEESGYRKKKYIIRV